MAKDVQEWILEVDLLEVFAINRVAIRFAAGHEPNGYKLLASRDGVDWSEAASRSGAGRDQHTFPKTEARFVRVVAAPGGNRMAIASIHVFGVQAAPRTMPAPYRFAPPAAPNLKLWVKADEGVVTAGEAFVSEWRDQSGNNNHMVLPKPFTKLDSISSGTTVSTKKPVLWKDMKNGRPAVRFDGFDDCLVADGVSGSFENNTVFILFRPHSSSDYNQVFGAKGTWGQFMFHAGNKDSVYVGTSVDSRFAPPQTAGAMNPGQWELFTFTLNSGTAKLYNNSKLIGSRAMKTPAEWTGLMFGENLDFRDKNNGFSIDADVAEVLVYNVGLSDADIGKIHQYLSDKYDLSDSE